MSRFHRMVWVELLKVRRTAVPAFLILAPYVLVLLPALFAYFDGRRFLPPPGGNAWIWLAGTVSVLWFSVFFPLALGLLTALVAAIEHRAEGLRHGLVLPVVPWQFFFAKPVANLFFLAFTHLVLGTGILLSGWALAWLRPGLGFEASVPWLPLVTLLAGGTLAAFFAASIQTWVALLSKELAAPVALGFLAAGSLLALWAFGGEGLNYHPWAYPGQWARSVMEGESVWVWWAAGGVGGLLFSTAAAWGLARRDVF